MTGRRFERATARIYDFREGEESRALIALYVGGQRAGLVEFDAARRFAERILMLCDENTEDLVDGLFL